MALIEIDGLPFLKMGGSFHGYVSHNQRVVFTPVGGWTGETHPTVIDGWPWPVARLAMTEIPIEMVKNIQLWPWLLVITGYFYGIIHSINGVLLVLIT